MKFRPPRAPDSSLEGQPQPTKEHHDGREPKNEDPRGRRQDTSCATCTATTGVTSAAGSPSPLREISDATDAEAARERFGLILERSAEPSPRSLSCSKTPRRTCSPSIASLSQLAEAALHQPAGAGQPRDRRRSDVVGIFPNDAFAIVSPVLC
jgi:hypothetical protein